MQLTLIGQWKILQDRHITREEIKNTIDVTLALANAVVGKNLTPPQPDWQLNEHNSFYPTHSLPKEYQDPVLAPDLILTSSDLHAKGMGFTILEQLKQAGITPEIKYNTTCLNNLKDPVMPIINLIQTLATEGKKHIVIIANQDNACALLNLLANKNIASQPIDNGIAYTFPSINPENIGKEKYLCQRRFFEENLNTKIPVAHADYIEWKMPDFVYLNKRNIVNISRANNHVRE